MIRLQAMFSSWGNLTHLLASGFAIKKPSGRPTPKKVKSFQQRISFYNKHLDRYDRKFLIRPPDLRPSQPVSFPLTIPLRVRHIYNPRKSQEEFMDNSSKIHWNRLTPN